MDEVGKVLADAAEYISEHGWCKGKLTDANGSVCAIGALSKVLHNSVHPLVHLETHQKAVRRLGDMLGLENTALIPYWNDHPDRTAEDVILTLKKAAHANE